MSEAEQWSQDLMDFLQKVDDLNPKQRKKAVEDIIKKRFKKPKQEELTVTYDDFYKMISYAKNEYSTIPFPLRIGNKEIDIREQANYCMFIAVIAFLNNKEVLKKLPTFKKGL